ncbi:MAG: hypothetical protein FJ276_09470, partial [Planctomycetes bacterium]|nr:hypothetical protein [Planctomycetota bacterium]
MNQDGWQNAGSERETHPLVASFAHPHDERPAEPKPKLLEEARRKLRTLHLAFSTEKAYLSWIERYLRFHKERAGQWVHPLELGSAGANQFLSFLAVERKVAASTQNQAFAALLFLYTRVLDTPIRIDAERAKPPERLPVVLSINEVRSLLLAIPPGVNRLMAGLLYGAGLRLRECCRLRVKDLDFDRKQIFVSQSKGAKDRNVPMPARLIDALRRQV